MGIITKLINECGLTSAELAEKLNIAPAEADSIIFGGKTPDKETLSKLSKLLNVTENTLLGSPRTLICQCCGRVMLDNNVSREPDGSFNEQYCRQCYSDGKFNFSTLEELVDFLAENASNKTFPPEKAREYFEQNLPKLNHWK